jgi:CRISPR type I-E-associated protein CasB/Cse2
MSEIDGEKVKSGPGPILRAFNRSLQGPDGDKALRARLRRAVGPGDLDAVLGGTRLQARGLSRSDDALDVAAILCAEVEVDTGPEYHRSLSAAAEELGKALAGGGQKTAKALKEQRFRILASAERPDDFFRLLRSALELLENKAPLVACTEVMWAWLDRSRRHDARVGLARGYYEAVAGDLLETKD